MSQKIPKTEAWAIYTKGNKLCHDGNRFNIYISLWEAQMELLRCKWQARTLDGYKLVRVEI